MCGRYNIIDDPLTQALMMDLGLNIRLPTRYNIAPTERVPVVSELNGKRQCREMRWWLVPSWSDGPSTKYSMFNELWQVDCDTPLAVGDRVKVTAADGVMLKVEKAAD